MQPQQLRKLARRWAIPVAFITVVAGIIGFAVAKHATPIYQADATVLVVAGPQSTNNSAVPLSPDEATATAAALMKAPPTLQQVINELHLGVNTDQLAKQVTTTPETGTELVDVAVQDPSPTKAALIANTLATAYSDAVTNQNALRVNKLGAALLQQIANVTNTLQSEDAQLAKADRQHADTTAITAEITGTTNLLSTLTANYSNFQSTQEQNLVTVSVAAPASVPVTPVSPKVLLDVLLALFAGLLVGLGVVAAFEYFDQGLHTEQDVRELLGVTCLAIVPRFEPNQRSAASKRRQRSANEAYSRLRTNLLFAELDRPLRSIVVTSSRAGEGKTRTAANLAVSLAASEKSILLLDADMHRPSLHRMFGRPLTGGMSDMLLASGRGAPLLDSSYATAYRHLSLVTCGVQPPNPSELMASPRAAALLQGLEFQRDVVVIDTPPVQAVTDALSISAHASGVIVVVESGKTNADQVRAVINSLHKVGATVLGVVLNKANQRSMRSYYYYDYGPSSQKSSDVALVPPPPPPPPASPEGKGNGVSVNGEAHRGARSEKERSIERSEVQ